MFTLPRPKHLVGQKSKASIGDFAKLFRNANLLAVYGVAAAIMGRLADKVGNGKILLVSLAVMFAGIGLTCAASWVGKLSTADKARISAGYMLVYYVGASVVGTAGGKFLTAFLDGRRAVHDGGAVNRAGFVRETFALDVKLLEADNSQRRLIKVC